MSSPSILKVTCSSKMILPATLKEKSEPFFLIKKIFVSYGNAYACFLVLTA